MWPWLIRIDFPALDRLLDHLQSTNTLQQQINALTAQLKQANTAVATAVDTASPPKE